jgi:hypothetical protein
MNANKPHTGGSSGKDPHESQYSQHGQHAPDVSAALLKVLTDVMSKISQDRPSPSPPSAEVLEAVSVYRGIRDALDMTLAKKELAQELAQASNKR